MVKQPYCLEVFSLSRKSLQNKRVEKLISVYSKIQSGIANRNNREKNTENILISLSVEYQHCFYLI